MTCRKAHPLVIILIMATMTVMQDVRICLGAALPMPSGINFLGIGYNIIEGNPEGGDVASGGVDPGLRLSRRILKLTFDEEKTSADGKYRIPDEVVFVRRHSAFMTSTLNTFYGTQSYASKLSTQVQVTGKYEGALINVEFAASLRYKSVAKKTTDKGSVFLSNETITNLGRARYMTGMAQTGKYWLEDNFVAEACRLPAEFSEENYMAFIDNWGTHIVTEVDLGIREGENLVAERSSFVNYAAQNAGSSLNASGSFAGFSSSVSVDMESFSTSMDSETHFGKMYSRYKVGSEALNEPIKVQLISMPDIFEPEFWTRLDMFVESGHCNSAFDRISVKDNMVKALLAYAEWRGIKQSTNPDIRIPITWPEGKYSLPKGVRGCPNTEFRWSEGHLIQATSASKLNKWSDVNLDLSGWWSEIFTRQEFCTKPVATASELSKWEFQPGSYCIFQYDGKCPNGFESGFLHWGGTNNIMAIGNEIGGVVPTGTYKSGETDIHTCCRGDGLAENEIFLPVDDSFVLLARYDHCQQVHGMKVQMEWLHWDTSTPSRQSSVHPYHGLYRNQNNAIRLVYCYYYTGSLDRRQEDISKRKAAYLSDYFRILKKLEDLGWPILLLPFFSK